MKPVTRSCVLVVMTLTLATGAWAQWSSDPSQNLDLSNIAGADQVQPKLLPLPNNTWYVSWFNNNPNDPPPNGYDVYYQLLSATGVEQFQHDGVQVAKLTLSSTQDYGLAIDANGNALLAFQDDRRNPDNPQITAAKMSPTGQALWGPNGVALTWGPSTSYNDPKVTVTTDGYIVVGWTANNAVVLQRLNPNGLPTWIGTTVMNYGISLQEPGYNYTLADLHAADNGSVIVSFVRNQGFGSNNYLYANKLSSTGQLMWGSSHVHVYDGGSLQFGEFPYFTYDGNGGAVFSWYSSSPLLQSFAQHILANGTEAFGHNGSLGSTNTNEIQVEPTASYNPSTQETFLFWTEQDQLQDMSGVSGQKFNSTGARQWSDSGLTITPLSTDTEDFVTNVQIGSGALVFWNDSPGYGSGTIQAIKLDGTGATVCPRFGVSTASSDKARLTAGVASSGLTALAWEDDRNGENDIYIQNVNADCTLGIENKLMVRK
jgi:hypothetical protein